ncbi:hypothetical protein [Spirosoma linguale]|uniref:Lipoprotein n=1 Tax=Spirosoma linguale (strain ATCC 33905 / DSM 74 / LMG 10896 / Claus 1) TaxID=504472 RepID=D2QJZ2_SPILD|nr:hypothetical protein Slin_1063 [Spirosoma linguale DSM 74]
MKRFSGFLIVGTILFFACKSNETSPADSISLALHQSGRLGSDVVVRADSIQDSRCPSDPNVSCIWAGQAKVKLLLKKDSDSTAVRLLLGADPGSTNKRPDSTTVSLKSETYKVVLREVTPLPTLSNGNQPKTAVVQVTKI